MHHVKIGYAPTRRSIFSAPDAIKYRNLTADRLRERFGESAVMYGSELKFRDGVSKTASTHRKDGREGQR